MVCCDWPALAPLATLSICHRMPALTSERMRDQSAEGPPSASILIMEPGHTHQDDGKQSAWHHGDSHTDLRSSDDVHGPSKYQRERQEVGDGSDLFSRSFQYSSTASPDRGRVFPECEVTNHPRYIEVKPLESGSGHERHYDHTISFPSTSSSPDKRSRYQKRSPEHHSTSHQDDNSTDNCQTSQVSFNINVPR